MLKKSMEIHHNGTGILIAEPERDPLEGPPPRRGELLEALRAMILSVSGWRKVFSSDGDEESFSPHIDGSHRFLVAAAALAFSEDLLEKTAGRAPTVYTACDARPTGPQILDVMSRIMLAMGLRLRPLFISPAPELMATVKLDEQADGFVYVSASHNPIGHNGIKFGGAEGTVFGGQRSRDLITRFRSLLEDPSTIDRLSDLSARLPVAEYADRLSQSQELKERAMADYRRFSRTVFCATDEIQRQDEIFRSLTEALQRHPIGVVAELNGSARGCSIDGDFLREFGVRVALYNDRPGEVVHRIVPEGAGLDLCRQVLERAHRDDPAHILGYVPDNDGDRGNLVYIKRKEGKAYPIPAQSLFALTVLSELLYQEELAVEALRGGAEPRPKAVVVNGPTSMVIEKIADYFDARVFRAEVGEANVVSLAAELRRRSYDVRILGEGSNGGNITHPAGVRDPLNTLLSIIRLLSFRDQQAPFQAFRRWCELRGLPESTARDFSIEEVLSSLPSFSTTSAYEPEALMRISCQDHGVLKTNYEKVFSRQWERKREELKTTYDICSWREVNYEGTTAREGVGPEFRSPEARGGLKIIFSNHRGEDSDFLWMRGSGTEPVFRVLVDSQGEDSGRHDYLLQWHRSMIAEADELSTR